MDTVTVYLKTALFSVSALEDRLPSGTTIIKGHLKERHGPSVLISCHQYYNDRGQEIGSQTTHLEIPWSKIDHIQWESA